MPFRKLIFIFYLFCSCSIGAIAQLRFERIGNKQGLSQSTILKIFQDKKGFIWFATRDGLNKYDGYNFTIYRHVFNNPNSLSSSNISCITEDYDGNLWIGTADGGVNKMDKDSGNFIHFRQTDDRMDISKLNISSITVSKNNQIWAASYKNGLINFDNNHKTIKWKVFETKPISITSISQIYQDTNENLWLGGNFGSFIQISKDGKVHFFKIDNNLP